MGMFDIRLEKVRFFARHGVFSHETRDGNEFEVSLSVKYSPEEERIMEDRIEGTISYVSIYEIVKQEMQIPRRLLETVACSIVKKIKTEFPFCQAVECSISKITPPIKGFTGSVSVTYSE